MTKHLSTLFLLVLFISLKSFAATTFVLPTCTYSGGSVINFLVTTTGTPDSGSPYTIIIPTGVVFTINKVQFDLTTLSGTVQVEIQGTSNGGQIFFKDNGSSIIINTGDQIIVSPSNSNGLYANNSYGQYKVYTDGQDYTAHQLSDIIAAGGVQGDGTLGTAGLPLPVTWLYYEAQLNDREVVLRWSTAMEENNDYFAVEHSLDGVHFQTIGLVMGAGISRIARHYTFTHGSPAAGYNYYRLRQVDFDGRTEYTPVMAVFNAKGPTPAIQVADDKTLKVSFPDQAVDGMVFVLDMQGQVLASAPAAELMRMELSHLPAGIYVLAVKQAAGGVYSSKFLLR